MESRIVEMLGQINVCLFLFFYIKGKLLFVSLYVIFLASRSFVYILKKYDYRWCLYLLLQLLAAVFRN
jgi:hypothetical protein